MSEKETELIKECQNIKKNSEDQISWWKLWKRQRYVVAILAFFGFFNFYTLRVNLSIAIVAMTTNTSTSEFDWDSKMQGYILSSFFCGYLLSQVFGGWMGTKIGGKRIFGFGIGGTALFTILTPFLVNQSVYLLMAVRTVIGLLEGLAYPCIQVVLSHWAPPLERTRMATIAFSGVPLGTVVALPVCAYLNNVFGWESIFYFFGVLGMIWVCVWWYIVAESPSEDRFISNAELNYITESLRDVSSSKNLKYPWKSIFTSAPVWAIIVAQFCDNWGFYTLLTELPTYMKDVLKFDLTETGILSSLPYIASAVFIQLTGQLSDFLLAHNILTTTQVRKLVNSVSFIFQMVFMLAAAYSMTSGASIACLTIASAFGGAGFSGYGVNFLDISPQYSSVIVGISNTIATLSGIISPTITGYIVTTGTQEEWRIVFFISSALFCFGCIVYAVFASGDLQPWAANTRAPKACEVSNTGRCNNPGFVLDTNVNGKT